MTEDSLGAKLREWDDAAWCLAALALAAREPTAVTDAARDVLGALGIAETTTAHTGTAQQVASQAAAPLHITSALLSGGDLTWAGNDDNGLRAQGRASAQAAPMFRMFMLPRMGDLTQRLASDGARMLDVGTGVGALAVGFAEVFPALHVLGLDIMDRALELAAETIASSPAGERVSVRKQDVADLAETEAFDLVWLPAPFIPPDSLGAGVRRIVAGLRPGGWVIVGHGKYGESVVADALSRLKTIAFGGTALTTPEVQQLLNDHGLTGVQTFPTPPGVPAITVGRRAT